MVTMQEVPESAVQPSTPLRTRAIQAAVTYWLAIRCIPVFFVGPFGRWTKEAGRLHGIDWLLEPFELLFRAFALDDWLLWPRDDRAIILLSIALAIPVLWLGWGRISRALVKCLRAPREFFGDLSRRVDEFAGRL